MRGILGSGGVNAIMWWAIKVELKRVSDSEARCRGIVMIL